MRWWLVLSLIPSVAGARAISAGAEVAYAVGGVADAVWHGGSRCLGAALGGRLRAAPSGGGWWGAGGRWGGARGTPQGARVAGSVCWRPGAWPTAPSITLNVGPLFL